MNPDTKYIDCLYPNFTKFNAIKKGCRCISCVNYNKEYMRKYYLKKKEKLLQRQKDYGRSFKNTENKRIYDKKHREKTKDKRRIQGKLYYSLNKKTIKLKQIEYNKTYGKFPSTKARRAANCRARQANTKLPICPVEKQKIIDIYAKSQQISKETGIQHHVDHIIPISRGGKHLIENLQILTATKNLQKGNR